MISVVHPTAIVEDTVQIGNNVRIGAYCVIRGNVVIEDNVNIHDAVIISDKPEHKTALTIEGGRVFIGEGATIFHHVGITTPIHDETYIGRDAFVMGGASIGHDAKVMSHAIVGGNATMAGHSVLGEYAFLGDNAVIHQWNVIGAGAMIGMGTPVRSNVPPFLTVYGNPPKWKKYNQVGIERNYGDLTWKQVNDFYQTWIDRYYSSFFDKSFLSIEEWWERYYKEEVIYSFHFKKAMDDFFARMYERMTYSKSNRGRLVKFYA